VESFAELGESPVVKRHAKHVARLLADPFLPVAESALEVLSRMGAEGAAAVESILETDDRAVKTIALLAAMPGASRRALEQIQARAGAPLAALNLQFVE
jgi:hypothetical protein